MGHFCDSGTWQEAESLGREKVVLQLLLHACSVLGAGFSGLVLKGWERWPQGTEQGIEAQADRMGSGNTHLRKYYWLPNWATYLWQQGQKWSHGRKRSGVQADLC